MYLSVAVWISDIRNLCLEKFPTTLPKVLQSVTWNNRSDVAQVQTTCYHTYVILKYRNLFLDILLIKLLKI